MQAMRRAAFRCQQKKELRLSIVNVVHLEHVHVVVGDIH